MPDPSYQPNAEELRLNGPFEDAIKVLVAPVQIRRVMPRKSLR